MFTTFQYKQFYCFNNKQSCFNIKQSCFNASLMMLCKKEKSTKILNKNCMDGRRTRRREFKYEHKLRCTNNEWVNICCTVTFKVSFNYIYSFCCCYPFLLLFTKEYSFNFLLLLLLILRAPAG